jgi:APA family basic amino acid/polyamine antiporter
MLFVSLFAAFIPGRIVGEMTSIGTLFAFILVCIGVLVMRSKMKDAPRAFRTPFVPLVPILGVFTCLFMMVFLPLDTWIRLIAWMMIGLDVYLSRGILKSNLNAADSFKDHSRSYNITAISGLALTIILAILGTCHHFNTKGSDEGLVIFSFVMVIFHLIYYGLYLAKGNKLKGRS